VMHPKVFQINYGMGGGAWKSAQRLSKALTGIGQISEAIDISDGTNKTDAIVYKIGSKLDYEIGKRKENPSTTTIFSGYGVNQMLMHKISEFPIDAVINLHWLPGNISKEVSDLLKTRNVVLTLHDMRHLTGYCHHAAFCEQYQSSCSHCPQSPQILQGLIKNKFEKYLTNFKKLENVSIVTPSTWLYEICVKSRLMRNYPIHQIYNPIPEKIFNLNWKNGRKNVVGPLKICLYGAANKGKGGRVAMDVISKVQERNEIEIEVNVFGKIYDEYPNVKQVTIPEIINDTEFAAKLSDMDLLLHFSDFENSPNLIREAQALGVHVITNFAGGSAELILNSQTGLATDPQNFTEIESYFLNLSRQKTNAISYESFKNPDLFSEKLLAMKYLAVYQAGAKT
jgi:glycosyltransferase involved in cell wall biosynthesis